MNKKNGILWHFKNKKIVKWITFMVSASMVIGLILYVRIVILGFDAKIMNIYKEKISKSMIEQNLNISTIEEHNSSNIEVEYKTISRIENNVKINIVITDKINGIKQIDYPEGDPLKVVEGKKETPSQLGCYRCVLHI